MNKNIFLFLMAIIACGVIFNGPGWSDDSAAVEQAVFYVQ